MLEVCRKKVLKDSEQAGDSEKAILSFFFSLEPLTIPGPA